MLAAVVSGGVAGWLRWRPLVAVGVVSYSLYLYHIGVQFALLRVIPFNYGGSYLLETACNAALMLAPVLLVAAVMYRAVEAPSLKAVRRFR